MKLNILKTSICVAGMLVVIGALETRADITTPDGNTLFTPTVNLSTGPQNGYVGTVGGTFLTSYNDWPGVNWLGYYDKDGDGLANSHQVALWDNGGNLLGSATIPAGTAAPLWNGFRWAQIPTVGLWYNAWYVVGAETDGVDLFGDLISADSGQIAWNAEFTNLDSGYEWTRQGRYGGGWGMPSNASGNNSIYPAVNLGYNLPIVVPEPGSMAILGLGMLIFLRSRKS